MTPILLIVILVNICIPLASSTSPQCPSNNGTYNEITIGSTVRALVDGSSRFSFNLLRALEVQDRSVQDSAGIFFSPYSVWSALMVTYMGAGGRTEMELQNALGTSDSDKRTVWEAFRNILHWNTYQQLSSQKATYHSANRVIFQKGTPIKDCIQQLIESDIGFADFRADPKRSTDLINDWVKQQTMDKIQDLIPQGSINTLTKMVIANAIYFKEKWQTQFDPQNTRRGRFTLSNRRTIDVNMMNLKGRFHYGISEELQCTGLDLLYDGGELSMIVLLPNNRYYGVSILANRLTPSKLQNFLNEMYPREAMVSIPKFKLEDNFQLSPVLSKMGIRTLFDGNQSDLSGFTGSRDLVVDSVHHKSFIEVNEEGTEAAAATAVLMSRSARPLGPAAFTADYPFIFMIRDNVANVILFIGAVKKPPEFGQY